jgi:imidazolonepropionase
MKIGAAAMNDVCVIPNGTMIIGLDGRIHDIGTDEQLAPKYADASFEHDIDAEGKCVKNKIFFFRANMISHCSFHFFVPNQCRCVLPGLVDGHTHPVFAGDRCNEFKMKLAGATYMEVHAAGGGIHFTVRHTRAASEDELLKLLIGRLRRMGRFGTTLVEAKSGYGLDLDTELKMLRVLRRARDECPIEIVANYCGAHSVPQGSTAAEATRRIIDEYLPAIIQSKQRGEIDVEFMDVFCEKGVFELEDSRRIMAAGAACGLHLNFHGDELNYTGSAEMGAELGACAISHLECISDAGIQAMADARTVATLLPTTAYVLRIHPPPARRLIDSQVPVALGTDFNPNAHCVSMPQAMNLACVLMKMTVAEALVAATINSAGNIIFFDFFF